MDKYFKVSTLSRTENPERLIYQALRQDYSADPVLDKTFNKSNEEYGELIVKHLLGKNRMHMGPLEHPAISFNCSYFPHDVVVQARTHRVGVTFDVMSQRYTSARVLELSNLFDNSIYHISASKILSNWEMIHRVFYYREPGNYTDREGKKYIYEKQHIISDMISDMYSIIRYENLVSLGVAEEHARQRLPQSIRQHFVVSFNMRSLMHFLDLRAKMDAQYEIRCLCDLLMVEFEKWSPTLANWYKNTRWKKANLAP